LLQGHVPDRVMAPGRFKVEPCDADTFVGLLAPHRARMLPRDTEHYALRLWYWLDEAALRRERDGDTATAAELRDVAARLAEEEGLELPEPER
jgi:hypothetical protein